LRRIGAETTPLSIWQGGEIFSLAPIWGINRGGLST
jgi:hypothetical protein